MQKENKKSRLLKNIDNASSMMIFIVFFVLCVIIAAVIGIYSVKEKEQKEASSTSAGEFTQEQSEREDEAVSKTTDEEAGDRTQADEGETTIEDISESQSNEIQDIIFEDCGEEGVLVKMIHTGGWGDEDDPVVQYDIVIDNTTDADISEWCIKIKVGADAACDNIWNGTAELENGVLTITSADFNGTIVSGTQASLGIIIEKPGTPVFEDVTFK